jgi:PadR family transcriptional regulator AphA
MYCVETAYIVQDGLSSGKRKLATGDYLFLAFLKAGPLSAYELKKEMSSSVNFFWSAQHSQVYQQANRLRRDGYIEQRGPTSARNRRLLALTEEGAHAVDRWLSEPAAPYRIYDESLAKLYFASFTDNATTTALLEDQRRHHAELLAEFERIHAVLSGVDFGDVIPGQFYALRLGVEVESAYLRWIDQTLADLRRRQVERESTQKRSRRRPVEMKDNMR